ncbi:hypothetical protein MMC11_003149 [Xylographa trunciseda]|nr:hypothetical protein [Xylographa trunciseda]
MAILEHVEVKIISSSTEQQLKEYDDPDPEAVAVEGKIQKYIEAESGQEFKIEVTLKKGFCFHGADGIKIGVDIDGDTFSYIVVIVSNIRIKRDKNWFLMNFAFGEVTVDEDLHLDSAALLEELQNLGSIHITVCRATKTPLVEPKAHKSAEVTTSRELDKKLIVKSISHTFKLGTGTTIKEPHAHKIVWKRMRGRYDAAIQRKFLYRSYKALQYLGCIPTTSEPVPLSERPPADMTDAEKASQITGLRAETKAQRDEIQQLMQANQTLIREMGETRDLNKKITALQAALGNLGTIPPPPGSNISTIKRERVKQELNDEGDTPSRSAKRSRPEYVTLDD